MALGSGGVKAELWVEGWAEGAVDVGVVGMCMSGQVGGRVGGWRLEGGSRDGWIEGKRGQWTRGRCVWLSWTRARA